jgi:hypothetical protein
VHNLSDTKCETCGIKEDTIKDKFKYVIVNLLILIIILTILYKKFILKKIF